MICILLFVSELPKMRTRILALSRILSTNFDYSSSFTSARAQLVIPFHPETLGIFEDSEYFFLYPSSLPACFKIPYIGGPGFYSRLPSLEQVTYHG
jgi:hypothetical protein